MALDPVSAKVTTYASALDAIMVRLNDSLLQVLSNNITSGDINSAAKMLNAQPEFMAALTESGYFALNDEYVSTFTSIPKDTKTLFNNQGLPEPEFGPADAVTFRQLAANDISKFDAIGAEGMTTLRQALVSDVIATRPFSELVEAVRAATVGVDGKGSPLANHAYTHANTAIGEFNGTVVQKAGESIGFDSPTDEWEVIGVLDEKTRDVCLDALNDPVRTRQEWQDAGYWGGSPGGWNCRHILVPKVR